MESPLIEELCPETIGEDLIALTLAEGQNPRAFHPVTIQVDYSACLPDGVVQPIEITVRSPSPSGFERRTIRKASPPGSFVFTPREGGTHLVLVRELYHNHWIGRLRVKVAGDPLRASSA